MGMMQGSGGRGSPSIKREIGPGAGTVNTLWWGLWNVRLQEMFAVKCKKAEMIRVKWRRWHVVALKRCKLGAKVVIALNTDRRKVGRDTGDSDKKLLER